MCVLLVIFSRLPLFSPTDPGWGGWASGKGGWARAPGSWADGWQGGDRQGSGGVTVPVYVPSGRSQGLSLSCCCWARGQAEASGAKTLGEDCGAPASPTKAWTEVSGLMFN